MKFEYKEVYLDIGYSSAQQLNKWGSEGWEAVCALLIRERTIFILLKRSIPEDE